MENTPSTLGSLGVLVVCLSLVSLGTMAPHLTDRGSKPVYLPSQKAEAVDTPELKKNIQALLSGNAIDLNTASITELELLPGIGPKLAQRIVENRKENGLYAAIDDLLRVRGIGPGKLERIRSNLTIRKRGEDK